MADTRERAYALETKDRAFFRSIPWTSRLMDDPAFKYTPTLARVVSSSGEDSFYAETLNTPTTISHLLTMYRKPTVLDTPVRETRTLMQLGTKLNGWIDVVHGGVQSFLLDETMASLLSTSKRVPGARAVGNSSVTAELKVRFVKTMRVPNVVCVTARLKDFKGRKCYTEAEVTDEHGTILASAEALFLIMDVGAQQTAQKL